jgi:hypothetical protein
MSAAQVAVGAMRCTSREKNAIPQGSGGRNFNDFNQQTGKVSGCEIKPKEGTRKETATVTGHVIGIESSAVTADLS